MFRKYWEGITCITMILAGENQAQCSSSGWSWQEWVYRPSRKSQQGHVTGVPRDEAGGTSPSTTAEGDTCCSDMGWEWIQWQRHLMRGGKCRWKGSFLPRIPQWTHMPLGRTLIFGTISAGIRETAGNNELQSFTYHPLIHLLTFDKHTPNASYVTYGNKE